MPVDQGKFQLYTSILPALTAGDWRLQADQRLSAKRQSDTSPLDENELKVDKEHINFRVKSPRYILPPDQALSTYPPANSIGSYGSRLPQIAIKRRTLPWERELDGQSRETPWMALVLIAEGEAKLETGLDVADCVSSDVTLNGVIDVEKGNALIIRKSMIDKVFPTQNDVPLLAHAREVDISDTELLMGDDDGFIAVVICNRLPLPAKDAEGNEVPVKYLACLVNLEGQFDRLLERSPDPEPIFLTSFLTKQIAYISDSATDDHVLMGTAAGPTRPTFIPIDINAPVLGDSPLAPVSFAGSSSLNVASGIAGASGATPNVSPSSWGNTAVTGNTAQVSSAEVSLGMARDFRFVDGPQIDSRVLDPEYRFPVLLHWSFTSNGDTTFRSLMEGLDSKLLGDAGDAPSDISGRLPLEVVESGHVGLEHKTREGDEVRSWYRGPLIPHPNNSSVNKRLPLAHSSDQLRIVIPDGREDLSLASAFEVGRLLTLSQPSIIASLMRWRQGHYHAARMSSLIQSNRKFWEEVLGPQFEINDFYQLGPMSGRFFVDNIVKQPEVFLGSPRPLVTPGRPIEVDGLPSDRLAVGLGIDSAIFRGNVGSVFERIRDVPAPTIDFKINDIGTVGIREHFELTLDNQRVDLVSNTLRNRVTINPVVGPTFPIGDLLLDGVALDDVVFDGVVLDDVVIGDLPVIPDVLDHILANPSAFAADEMEEDE